MSTGLKRADGNRGPLSSNQAGRLALLAGFAACLFAASASLAQATKLPDIVVAETEIAREGEGARRDALNKRERKAFDNTSWAKLSSWTNGSGLTATDTKDKPVLIATWTDYLPSSRRVPALATRMAEKFGKQGLIVVLAHGEQAWDKASKPTSPEGTKLLVAHDAKGEFRKALDVDSDPDFYIIDRAGQLRFADVTLEALDAALTRVVEEDAAKAAGISGRLLTEQADRERAIRKATAGNVDANFTKLPDLPFETPSEEAYEKVKWPKRHLDDAKQQEDRGAELEAKNLVLPDEGWADGKPKTAGKLIVTIDWHPLIRQSYDGVFEFADQLQLQYPRDVVVISAMSQFATGAGGQAIDKKDNAPASLAKKFETFLASRKWKHALLNNSLTEMADQGGSGSGSRPLRGQADEDTTHMAPVMMIVSTDGKIRWWQKAEKGGAAVAFESALIDLLRIDPGVQSRRKAEAEWLARQQGKSEEEVKAAIEAAAGDAGEKVPPAPPK
jgi:hypothetical protein